jgi:hypothetical protein
LEKALGAVKETEANLDNVRSDLHGNVESVQEAAISITDHARNVSAPDDYSKPTATIDEASLAIDAANASLPESRDNTVKAREEARRIELDNIRKQTEEAHKQQEAAAAAAAGDGSTADGEQPPPVDASKDDSANDEPTEGEAIKALSINSRVPLLKELVEATRDHTIQTTKYAELALELQRERKTHGRNEISATNSTDDLDEDAAEDQAVLDEKASESEEKQLLLSPGRAQARAHCADPVLKVAGFKWCVALQQCLQTWEHECPGGEWNGALKKEVSHLTSTLAQLRRKHVRGMIENLREKLEGIKKTAGIQEPPQTAPETTSEAPNPGGPGEYGRLKGHVLQLRAQIEKYAGDLKVPVPEDPYASKHLPVPTEYQHGLPSAGGQSSQASQLAARLSSLVNEIATTTNRAAIAIMNREAEGVMSRLRTMTLGAHCLRCGKAHCDVHERDALLWPELPSGKKLRLKVCGCHSLANPRCACPKKSCAPPPPPAEKKKSSCDCPKKKKKCGCEENETDQPPPCGGKGQPKCVTPPVMCADPGTPMHSVRLGQTYTEGSKLQFLCQPPYRLVGDEFRTCSADARKSDTPTGDGNGGWRRAGDWTGTQPTCVPPKCPKPTDIEDGVTIGTDLRFPAKLEFKCNVGYTMEGVKSIQCLGTGQWNGSPPKCYPLQKPSAALTAEFDKSKEEANELAKELGIETAKERDPTPEEEDSEEQEKEVEAEKEMKEKSLEQDTKKKKKQEEDDAHRKTAMAREKEPENQPGTLEQLAKVARHAQTELKRAEANRKDVEALVLANSASTSMAEAYGNTANLLSGEDPVSAEQAATKRAAIVQGLLDDGSPLYRDGNQENKQNVDQETRGRDAASAAVNVGSKFASDLLNQLLTSQPTNPDTKEQDKVRLLSCISYVFCPRFFCFVVVFSCFISLTFLFFCFVICYLLFVICYSFATRLRENKFSCELLLQQRKLDTMKALKQVLTTKHLPFVSARLQVRKQWPM